MEDLIVTIKLLGSFKCRKKHTDSQKMKAFLGKGKEEISNIKHTDAEIFSCSKVIHISSSQVKNWVYGECPSWENGRDWKRKSVKERIKSYVKGFDEGFGVSFE
jgi:hypothetical protein